jgi:hypothetical protein
MRGFPEREYSMKVSWTFVSNAKSENKVRRLVNKFEDKIGLSVVDIKIEAYHKQDAEHRFKAYAYTDVDGGIEKNLYLVLEAVNRAAFPWTVSGPRDGWFSGVIDSRRSTIQVPGINWVSFEYSEIEPERELEDEN